MSTEINSSQVIEVQVQVYYFAKIINNIQNKKKF